MFDFLFQIINEYLKDGFNFIIKALESKEYLEDLSGLTSLHDETIMSEVLEYSGSESEESWRKTTMRITYLIIKIYF